jgi:hypothetical protein
MICRDIRKVGEGELNCKDIKKLKCFGYIAIAYLIALWPDTFL